MNQKRTHGIILSRVDFGEADRIITMLTPDAGKLPLMAKGVRRVKSKMAGGIELFSTSEITYLPGRGSVHTLISARLQHYYARITADIDRTMLGYELIKLLNTVTEDVTEAGYYTLLEQSFAALDDVEVSMDIVRAWFSGHLLKLAGNMPNLVTDVAGAKLAPEARYLFDFDAMSFAPAEDGPFGVDEIKFLRLLFSASTPKLLSHVMGAERIVAQVLPVVTTMRQLTFRV